MKKINKNFNLRSVLLAFLCFGLMGTVMADNEYDLTGASVTVTPTEYNAGTTQTFNVSVSFNTSTLEWADNIEFSTPAGWTLNSGVFNGTASCGASTAFSNEGGNAVFGILYPGGDSGCGPFADGVSHPFDITYTIPAGASGDVTITATLVGDGFGEPGASTTTATSAAISLAAPAEACILTCPDPLVLANPQNDCGVLASLDNPTATGDCAGEVITTQVEVSLLTDNFGGETTWEIRDDNSGAVIASAGPFTGQNATLIEETVDIVCGESYTFTIFDSFGDGICCTFGSGSYSLTVEGVVYNSPTGGAFGASESISFGTTCAPGATFITNDLNDGTEISNEFFPIGETTVIFSASDDDGNPTACTTTVTVADPVFEPGAIGCLAPGGHVTLSEENCDAIVSAGDLLQGTDYGCADFYNVELFYDQAMTQPLNNNLDNDAVTSQNVDEEIYAAVTSPTGTSCWTTIIPEDKTPPVLECPCALEEVSTIEGEITADSETFDPPNSVNNCTLFGADVFQYEATSLQLSADDSYTVEVASFDNAPFFDDAAALILYEGAFNPDNSCENIIGLAFGGVGTPLASITFDGVTGQNYVVVLVPTFEGEIGTYSLEISGAAGGSAVQQDEDCVFSCSDVADLLDGTIAGPVATANDACGPVTTTQSDQFIDNECGNDILRRTFTAVDGSGNSSTCTYDIIIAQPTADDIELPTNKDDIEDDALDCDANFAVDANGHPSPSVTGGPSIDGRLIVNGGSCDIAATYSDNVVEICEGTTKYIRTWTVIGWCEESFLGPVTHVQIIKVIDDEGPSISGLSDETIGTISTDCTGSAIIQVPTLTDNCSPAGLSYSVSVSAGTLNAAGTAVFGLPLGVSTVTITAVDGCGNESVATYDITIIDDINPVAICESFHTVSLTVDEPTLVDALVFDDGSYDNCELVEYQVRRMDNPECAGFDGTAYADKVPFYCCDVAGPNVMVELRIKDASGNTNSCMVEVEVQDKLDPIINCPEDKVLDCYEDPFDIELTGEATAFDNCSFVITTSTQGQLDNCGVGTIFRFFTATDPGGRTDNCVQRIDVINSTPFYICDFRPWNTPIVGCEGGHSSQDGVEWPADVELSTCGAGLLPEDLEGVVNPNDVRPQIFEDGCDLVGVTYEDVYLPIQPDACVKVIRNWKVYDWCTFDADNFDPNDPEGTPGYWEYVQIIKVLTTEDPVIEACEDLSFCSYDEDCENGFAELILNASDDCTPDEDLNYYYWIDAFNDGTNDLHASGNNASNTYPLGTHRILWHVEDGCGNVSVCEYLFVISDCKKPTPYAYNGLAIELMPNVGQVELWATDFDAGSFDNCGIAEFRINSPSVGPGASVPPANAAANVLFDCDDLGTNTVDLWVLDVNGNWDYVSTYVIVQDNMFGCDGSSAASIAGIIENEEANTVEGVIVSVEGDAAGLPDPAVTGATGGYAFPGLANGANYTVEADNDVDPLNGVTTFDLVLMSKHILGIEALNSPYKMIAADVNKSGSITTFDMVQLRKLILFIDTEFQSNTSWRFVDADFVFPNATNPFQTAFPEVLNFNNLAGEQFGDFVAVKVGDVNCSAQVNGFTGSSDDRSANGEVVFGVKDQALVAGETYTVDFTAADFAEVLGYQFTLAFDNNAVEFVEVETSLEGLSTENFGMSLINEGVITTSWNSINAVSLDADAKVFSMTFVAKSNAQLSEVLAVNSRYTKAEAYDNNVNLMNIGLSFNGAASVAGEFELYQNQPNPFKSETVIGFNLPEGGAATLTIYDVAGKVLKVYNNEFAQGYNEVQINRSELSGAGVLYYQLDTENYSATKKMIMIK